MIKKPLITLVLALLMGLPFAFVAEKPASGAGELPDGFAQSRFVSGLKDPAFMAFAPDGRLFVTEQSGKVRVVKNGRLLDKPFVDLSDKVEFYRSRGLLGIAVDPNFENNGFIYLYYTRKAGERSQNRVVRYKADPRRGDVAEKGSEKLLYELDRQGPDQNHNGGAINFGEDGKLYVSVGENRQEAKAQKLDSTFGKMLRINKDGSIPEDNPFYEEALGKYRAIWTRGLRNPFDFAVQPGTGRIFINDVGYGTWEEINEGQSGANYGWPRYEGPEDDPSFDGPFFAYEHDSSPETTGCAITGGAFYNPETATFPSDYVGDYYFADYCNGWIRRLDLETEEAESFKVSSNEGPVDMKVSDAGDLYFISRANGSIEKIQHTG